MYPDLGFQPEVHLQCSEHHPACGEQAYFRGSKAGETHDRIKHRKGNHHCPQLQRAGIYQGRRVPDSRGYCKVFRMLGENHACG